MSMSKDKKIVEYSIDEKTAKSLQIQFQREYVYSKILSKLLEELAYLNKL